MATVGVSQPAALIFSVWLFPHSVIALNGRPAFFCHTSLHTHKNLVVVQSAKNMHWFPSYGNVMQIYDPIKKNGMEMEILCGDR